MFILSPEGHHLWLKSYPNQIKDSHVLLFFLYLQLPVFTGRLQMVLYSNKIDYFDDYFAS